MLFLSVFLLSMGISAQTEETILKSSDFTCISNNNGDEYLSFGIQQPVQASFLIKSDICQLLEVKEVPSAKGYKKEGYLLIDGKLRPLELNEQYAAMIPQKVYYNRAYNSVVVIEFYLYSHIATSIYRYVVLAFSNDGTISFDELDFDREQKIEHIYKVYTSPYRVPPLLVRYSEED